MLTVEEVRGLMAGETLELCDLLPDDRGFRNGDQVVVEVLPYIESHDLVRVRHRCGSLRCDRIFLKRSGAATPCTCDVFRAGCTCGAMERERRTAEAGTTR